MFIVSRFIDQMALFPPFLNGLLSVTLTEKMCWGFSGAPSLLVKITRAASGRLSFDQFFQTVQDRLFSLFSLFLWLLLPWVVLDNR